MTTPSTTTPIDPMEYFREFGEDGIGIGLSASDSLCNESADSLHGLLQTKMPDRGGYACAYLTPHEMRELASELVNLAANIEAYEEKEKVRKSKLRWNHLMDVAFTVTNSTHEKWGDIPVAELIEALEKRLANLKSNPEESAGAFGFSDTIEEERK